MREQKEASSWNKFRLLMWKNLLQQWRHYIRTTMEILIPVLTMGILLVLRSQIRPWPYQPYTFRPFSAQSLDYSSRVLGEMNTTHISIAYSPRSDILEQVITNAVGQLFIGSSRDVSPDTANGTRIVEKMTRNSVTVISYDNSLSLYSVFNQEEATRRVIAAVQFDDSLYGSTELPADLSFSLRFPERPRLFSFFGSGSNSWRTDLVFPTFEEQGPRQPFYPEGGNDPGYVSEMFIALQHTISLELISTLTGTSLSDFVVSLQRYPHPSYVDDYIVQMLGLLMPMFVVMSFSYSAANLVRAIAVEKEMQLKETMKIMGLPTWLHWMAWFCKQFIYMIILAILLTVILKVKFTLDDGTEYALLTNTSWSVVFVFLMIYFICTILFCFMISSFFLKASTASLFAGIIWFATYIPSFLLMADSSISSAVQVLTCFFINSAMSYGFSTLLAAENTGGMQWGEFFASPSTESSRFTFGHVIIMLVVDCVLYMLVALYFEQVLPGPYGTPQPWNFFLKKQFWVTGYKVNEVNIVENMQNVVKEEDPSHLPIGVQINKLKKSFGDNVAVDNLSLNIYDEQITVLLGHNGAGKSTVISMLTGNLEISSGSVSVAGFDIAEQTRAARSNIGLCPQHNILFDDLTVREHLEFFARLKGFTGKELEYEIDMLISKLEIEEKRNSLASNLSGGQKRRLSVGIALCGAAKVVLLDEPTSGMDPASRRALWDLLQKEKKGRSMILTTHFMDEADILGDRIAIMANGRLQCLGSPYFLKQYYGAGYTLVVVKDQGFQLDACTAAIRKHIPGIVPKEDRGSEVTYSLLSENAPVFEPMLNDLESNIESIKFTNYGLVVTTMEDVFMSVGADLPPTTDLDRSTTTVDSVIEDPTHDVESTFISSPTENSSLTGMRLIWQQVLAIWMKLWLVKSRSWQHLLIQILVPIFMINVTLGVFQLVMASTGTFQQRLLSLEEGYASTETLLSFNGAIETSIGFRAKTAYEDMLRTSGVPSMALTLVEGQNLDDYYMEKAETEMSSVRNSMLIGATFSDNGATGWFSNFGYHDVANSLAAVHKALLRSLNPGANLRVYNYPLHATYESSSDGDLFSDLLSLQLANGIGTSLAIVSAVYIMFYIKERASRAKLLQKAAGVQPVVMWGSAAIFDWLWFCIICLPILISCLIFNVNGASTASELGRMYLIMIVYGASMLPFNYVLSYLFNGPSTGFVAVFFVNVILGTTGAQVVEVLSAEFLNLKLIADILDSILQFVPLYSLVTAIRLLSNFGLVEWTCLQNCDYLSAIFPNIQECTMQMMCEHFPDQCCVADDSWTLWQKPGVLRYLTMMIVSMVIMWTVLMIVEYRLLQKVFNCTKVPPPLDERTMDSDVVDEMRHVELVGGGTNDSLATKRLSKYYGKELAVDQISFTVGPRECFGLLGVNGAGKTSTFKMLMGDEGISSGDALVGGFSVKTNITKVHENIGYCPQFDAVFEEMTGRDTLRLFSMLRGTPSHCWDAQGEALAHALGFYKYYDKQVRTYSGGNKRKLSTAVALLGSTRLVFVDEPTTGVDPAAKRQVWDAIRRVRRSGRSVVLTSHSMEECEALCSRLTIMVSGRFQCLGTPQHLKNKFSQGFTLTIKMRLDARSNYAANSESIKSYISTNFTNASIMEEFDGALTYLLPDRSVPWSRMFGIMEAAKRDLNIEDYSISQTTLEQIFLQFTKYRQL